MFFVFVVLVVFAPVVGTATTRGASRRTHGVAVAERAARAQRAANATRSAIIICASTAVEVLLGIGVGIVIRGDAGVLGVATSGSSLVIERAK